jgi:hypothetical protein
MVDEFKVPDKIDNSENTEPSVSKVPEDSDLAITIKAFFMVFSLHIILSPFLLKMWHPGSHSERIVLYYLTWIWRQMI